MRQRKNTRTMSETNNQAFGKFESLGAFLDSYKSAEKKSFKKTLKDMTVAESATAMKKQRSVVEVNATIAVKEPDDTDAAGGKHIRMQIQLTKIVQNDAAVSVDVKDALAKAGCIAEDLAVGDIAFTVVILGGAVKEVDAELEGSVDDADARDLASDAHVVATETEL